MQIHPPAIYLIGFNYPDRRSPVAREERGNPIVLMKAPTTVINHGDPILIPPVSPDPEVDYEGELALIIGKRVRDLDPATARDALLGYTVANDVTSRSWQRNGAGGQWTRGKNFDTFCPLGPTILPRERHPDNEPFRIQTWVNGELRQDGSTADMIFSIEEILVHLSAGNTLLPGTVILTGSPPGTGARMTPPHYLQPGDRIEITIPGIGTLSNPVGDHRS